MHTFHYGKYFTVWDNPTCCLVPGWAYTFKIPVASIRRTGSIVVVCATNISRLSWPGTTRTVKTFGTFTIWLDSRIPLAIPPSRTGHAGSFWRLLCKVIICTRFTRILIRSRSTLQTIMADWTWSWALCSSIAIISWNNQYSFSDHLSTGTFYLKYNLLHNAGHLVYKVVVGSFFNNHHHRYHHHHLSATTATKTKNNYEDNHERVNLDYKSSKAQIQLTSRACFASFHLGYSSKMATFARWWYSTSFWTLIADGTDATDTSVGTAWFTYINTRCTVISYQEI